MTSMKTASGKDKKSKREVRGTVSGNLGFIREDFWSLDKPLRSLSRLS